LAMTPDAPSPMIGVNGNAIVRLPLVDCVEQARDIRYILREAERGKETQLGRALRRAHAGHPPTHLYTHIHT
jgi:hypothetical protein